jgi:superfamily II DNA or RNA helicase
MNERPYQSNAIISVEGAFREFDTALGVAATGAGKTIIFSKLAARNAGRTLIIAHREELLSQAKHKLLRATGLDSELERAESMARLDARVVVASIQTLCRRFKRFPADHFSLVIVDEAHHTLADSYLPVLQHFLGGGAKILGVTATPGTKGKKALGNFYETIAFEVGLLELIRSGYLSPISVKAFPLHIGDVPIASGGDYDQNAVDAALDPYLESVVSRLKSEIGNRKTLVFLPLIKTVERFVALCRERGITAEGVSGESENRADILARHGSEFQVLANSMLLTEGYDDPEISAMMVLRPTRSEILFSQMVGRGTRIFCPHGCTERCGHLNRKRGLLLLDPLWLHEDMNLVRPASLVTGRDADRRSISERVAAAQEELDLLDALAGAEHEREKSLAEKLARMEKRKAKVMSVEEWAVLAHTPDVAEFEPTMRWHEAPVSDKQAEMLTRFGFDPKSVRGRGHAAALLDVVFARRKQNLASPRQVKLLRQMRHPNPETATFKDAATWLDQKLKSKVRA